MGKGTTGPRPAGDVIADELPEYLQKALRTAESLPREIVASHTPPGASDDRRLARARALVVSRGIPFEAATAIAFDRVNETDAVKLYRKWRGLKRYGGVLLVSAPYGHGKTFMASLAVSEGPPRGYPWGGRWPDHCSPRFITAGSLAFMGAYDNPEFNSLLDASVLAIDDLGTEFSDPKGMLKAKLNHIVAQREASFVWTVLTTNLGWEDFMERFGSNRIAARMQKGHSAWAQIEDQDYRRQ